MPKLTKRMVDSIGPEASEKIVWDTEVKGFGVRVKPSGNKSFLLSYRLGGKPRQFTIGKVGSPHDVESARRRAVELLHNVREGIDPQAEKAQEREAITVAELVDLYLEHGPALKPNKKQSSWNTDRTVFGCHVKPLLGRRLARDVTGAEIAQFQMDVAAGKSARDVKTGPRRRSRVTGGKRIAALSTAVLGAAYQFGMDTGWLSANPARGVKLFKQNRTERFLSEREVAVISAALTEIEVEDPRQSVMTDAVRLLIMTGCRKSEILTLEWSWVDWRSSCLRLPDSKTGAKVVPLADSALELLKRRWDESRPRSRDRHNSGAQSSTLSAHVLPAVKGRGHYVGLPHAWTKVKARADRIAARWAEEAGEGPDSVQSLAAVRLHDLRHSFASFAIADGASLFMLGKVLGHKQARTTEIYAHLSDDPLRRLANRTGGRLAALMRSGPRQDQACS